MKKPLNQNKMKQTAVDWLIEQMIERKYFAKDVPLSYTTLEHLVNQAIEIEKEQIASAWDNGIRWEGDSNIKNSEDYYNTTFKSE